MTAAKNAQFISWKKTAARTTVATSWFSMFELAGNVSGTLAGTSTTQGVVPTSATAGMPTIGSFNSNQGQLAKIEVNNNASNVGSKWSIYDLLFKSGAHAFNAADTLASQPSYATRVPATNYDGLEIWIECVTAFTGNLSVAVTYTNTAGTAARSTGTFATGAALTVGRMMQLPLQAGDAGMQKIESVTGTVATAGTFNVLVLRPIAKNLRVNAQDFQRVWGPDALGLPRVYDTSALYPIISSDTTSSGAAPELLFEIVNG